ncbi:MAG: PD-(D/E)XK nuclease family protein [Dietzia sp.]
MREISNVQQWEAQLETMRKEMGTLKAAGAWRSGPRTLLRQLGLHQNELMLCRALAWILTPDAWHSLGDRFVRGLLLRLGLSAEDADQAQISIEEVRGGTRADIVIRTSKATVVIEAKVSAPEAPEQCDRIAEAWRDEDPELLFLSPAGLSPVSAIRSYDEWHAISWREISALAESALGAGTSPETGEVDFIRTIKIYGG